MQRGDWVIYKGRPYVVVAPVGDLVRIRRLIVGTAPTVDDRVVRVEACTPKSV